MIAIVVSLNVADSAAIATTTLIATMKVNASYSQANLEFRITPS